MHHAVNGSGNLSWVGIATIDNRHGERMGAKEKNDRRARGLGVGGKSGSDMIGDSLRRR